ncbi:MAG: hypothetical protein V4617_03370 [Gemmatimonadota bacterium]
MRLTTRLRTVLASSAALVLSSATALQAQQPVNLAPNAPADKPVNLARECQLAAMLRATAPLVEQARASYPAARTRFLAGLPPRHTFFVTTLLRDAAGRTEQVFVVADSIRDGHIAGRIWSQIAVVAGYRLGQPYRFAETALLDWMIARPDGSEEGNVVGKFLDTYQPPATCEKDDHAG